MNGVMTANAPMAADTRTASDRANGVANMLDSAAQRLDGLCGRLGRAQAKPTGVRVDSAPAPMPMLPDSLSAAERSANEIHECIEFIESRL